MFFKSWQQLTTSTLKISAIALTGYTENLSPLMSLLVREIIRSFHIMFRITLYDVLHLLEEK